MQGMLYWAGLFLRFITAPFERDQLVVLQLI
jgi:hypothetical protein